MSQETRYVELIRNNAGDVLWAVEVANIEKRVNSDGVEVFVQVINGQIENVFSPDDMVELR